MKNPSNESRLRLKDALRNTHVDIDVGILLYVFVLLSRSPLVLPSLHPRAIGRAIFKYSNEKGLLVVN